MFYAYVLCSKKDGMLYVDSTSDLKRRLSEHNQCKSTSTKPRAPFVLVYYEAYKNKQDCLKRERSLKLRGQARTQLLKRISENLRDVT